jgi:C4-dicarboxylate transporter DctQ subunit
LKVLRLLDEKFEETILCISFTVTITLIFAQVIFRYALQSSLSWSEELARYLFVWQVWLGAAWAAKIDKHINITAFKDKFSEKPQVILEVSVMIIWLMFSSFLTYWGSDIVKKIFLMRQKSPALQIPMWIPYLSVPVGNGLMSFRIIQRFIRIFPRWKERWS